MTEIDWEQLEKDARENSPWDFSLEVEFATEAGRRRFMRLPELETYALSAHRKLKAANQMRLALAGFVSRDEAIRAWEAAQETDQ